MDIAGLQKELSSWAETQPDILALYLYGSQAEGHANALSDVDVAVLVKMNLTREVSWKLEDRWADVWGEKIDLRILNLGPVDVRFNIISRGQRLWERDVEAVAEIESLIRRKYWDLKPLFEQNWASLKAQVMENRSALERVEYQKTLDQIRAVHQRVKEAAKGTPR